MNATKQYTVVEEARRGVNRCPLCGWRFHVEEDWHLDEMFCQRCETRLVATDDESPSRWIAAGIYT